LWLTGVIGRASEPDRAWIALRVEATRLMGILVRYRVEIFSV